MLFRYKIRNDRWVRSEYCLCVEFKTPQSRKWKAFSNCNLATVYELMTNETLVCGWNDVCIPIVELIKTYDTIDEFVIEYIKKDFWNVMDTKDMINNEKQAFKFLKGISSGRWSKSIEIDMDVLKGAKNE